LSRQGKISGMLAANLGILDLGRGFDINRIRDLLNRLPIHTDSNQLINRYKSLLDMSNIIRLIHQISGVKMGLLITEFTKMLFIVRMYGREGRGCHVGRL
jgi:hypothetical protein